ncbi:MAG: hypothetical protein WC755_00980 [Candidatus Woesearchaeota archaeon]|jgi:hypothetical protein
MSFKITLDHLITKEELIEVYKLFCKMYEIQLQQTDEKRFLFKNYDCLIKNGYLDHKPFMTAKFFASKQDSNYHFHGYNDELRDGSDRDLQFQELITKYFSNLESNDKKTIEKGTQN